MSSIRSIESGLRQTRLLPNERRAVARRLAREIERAAPATIPSITVPLYSIGLPTWDAERDRAMIRGARTRAQNGAAFAGAVLSISRGFSGFADAMSKRR